MDAQLLLLIYGIVKSLNAKFYEPQMEFGSAYSLTIRANQDFLEIQLAGIVVWSTQENEILDADGIERDLRREIRGVTQSLSKIDATYIGG